MARRMTRSNACSLLFTLDIRPDADFHQLSSGKVDDLLKAADQYGYRKPKNANGSRGRYFFQYVKRTCR